MLEMNVFFSLTNIIYHLSVILLFLSGVTDFEEFLRELRTVLLIPELVFPSALLIASSILLRIRGSFNFFSSIIIRLLLALPMTDVEIPVESCRGDFARS